MARESTSATRALRRRTVVFLISDFQDIGFDSTLRVAARKHDIIPVVVSDRRENELPNVGLLRLKDEETGQTTVLDKAIGAVEVCMRNYVQSETNLATQCFADSDSNRYTCKRGTTLVECCKSTFTTAKIDDEIANEPQLTLA